VSTFVVGCFVSWVIILRKTVMYNVHMSPSVVQWLSSLPLDRGFAGSKPAEEDGFLWAVKVLSTNSFGGEVKPAIPCRFYMLYPYSMWEILRRQNSRTFLHIVSALWWLLPESSVDESRMIRTKIGKHNRSVIVAVYGTPCTILPRKQ
jgi:hypothetical protein